MYLYMVIEAVVAVVGGILLAVCSKKTEGVEYCKLDKIGRVTNIVLIPVYVFLSAFCIGIGLFAFPGYSKGFLRVLGWIVAKIIPSASLFCGFSLGFSVLLRKKGKSKQSFKVQFIGLAGAALCIAMFCAFYGNLLGSIN